MRKYIQNSIVDWENNGINYRLITQNAFENSERTEFGTMELKEVVKVTLQKKEGWFNFLMTGSVWENIRVEKFTYPELERLGVNFNNYSSVKEEARTIYGMPY